MLRPWWFPEYTPDQQAVFDNILETIKLSFEQYNYQHIYTPAVESIDILKKWWDVIDQQVYGLYGLAQWPKDTKDYALHFDLTVPFARYILDHRNNLTFPFRRYQMQPVWRWESHKRGRYKEFWQFDVDAVWQSSTNIWNRYDIETVNIIDKTMDKICQKFDIKINKILKISHLTLTKNFLKQNWLDDSQIPLVLKLLDNYYKLPKDIFKNKLSEIVNIELCTQILKVIESKNPEDLYISNTKKDFEYEWYSDLQDILNWLKLLKVKYEYDICIVRWHNYYKWMVCEWFDLDDISLGSLAGWGRYDKITDFIDPRQSFSGVWASLGRFVSLAMEKINSVEQKEKYMFINFSDTREDIVRLYNIYIQNWKICEIYPTAAKLGKQFEYADRKNIDLVIIVWETEKLEWKYKVKNLKTGLESIFSLDNH